MNKLEVVTKTRLILYWIFRQSEPGKLSPKRTDVIYGQAPRIITSWMRHEQEEQELEGSADCAATREIWSPSAPHSAEKLRENNHGTSEVLPLVNSARPCLLSWVFFILKGPAMQVISPDKGPRSSFRIRTFVPWFPRRSFAYRLVCFGAIVCPIDGLLLWWSYLMAGFWNAIRNNWCL